MIISDEQLRTLVVKTGILSEKGIEEFLEYAKNSSSSFFDVLIERDVISDQNLGLLIADNLKIPFVKPFAP